MNKPERIFSCLLFLMLFFVQANAQDKIIKINNDTIYAKVVKITADKIIFRLPGDQPKKLPEIHKNNVKEIIYANGTKIRII